MESGGGTSLFERARDGDEGAFTRLSIDLFGPVFDFAARVTGNGALALHTAEEAVRRAGGSERPWPAEGAAALFFGHAWQVLDEAATFDVQAGAPSNGTRGAGLGGLGARSHAILDLAVRQGLGTAELARVLHITPPSAAVVVRRLTSRVEAGDEITPSVLTAYSALAPLSPPPGAAETMLRGVRLRGGLGEHRLVGAPPRAPVTSRERLAGQPLARVLAPLVFGAVLVGLLAFAPFSPVSLTRDPAGPAAAPGGDNAGAVASSPAATRTPRPTASPDAVVSRTVAPAPPAPPNATVSQAGIQGSAATATPTADRTPAPTAPAPPTATATPQATPTPTAPPATPTPAACTPTLSVPGGISLQIRAPSSFRLSNSFCEAAAYSIVVDAPWLAVDPVSGVIPAGRSIDIEIVATPAATLKGPLRGSLRILGPANTVTVVVAVIRD